MNIVINDKYFGLLQFRRSVKDVLKPEHNDHYLLRWLRGEFCNNVTPMANNLDKNYAYKYFGFKVSVAKSTVIDKENLNPGL